MIADAKLVQYFEIANLFDKKLKKYSLLTRNTWHNHCILNYTFVIESYICCPFDNAARIFKCKDEVWLPTIGNIHKRPIVIKGSFIYLQNLIYLQRKGKDARVAEEAHLESV